MSSDIQTQTSRVVIVYTLYITALAVFIASIFLSGLFAAVIFPLIKSLQPLVPGTTISYDDHWKLVAGHPTSFVFYLCSGLQLPLLIISLATGWYLTYLQRLRPIAFYLLICTVLIWLCIQFGVIIPMAGALQTYREASTATAPEAKYEAIRAMIIFQRLHPISTAGLAVLIVCGTVNICLAPRLLLRLKQS